AVTGRETPDFRTIAAFRRRHLRALRGVFVEVVRLCREAGLASLGHVALDGTKVKANASKHKAMSYERMREQERRLKTEVQAWLDRAGAADAGYCSERNLEVIERRGVRGYVATGGHRHGTSSPTSAAWQKKGPLVKAMRTRLRRAGRRSRYRLRKVTVEPVFGQIKGARGFRQFLLRGIEGVRGEWSLLAAAHNLLKLFGSRS